MTKQTGRISPTGNPAGKTAKKKKGNSPKEVKNKNVKRTTLGFIHYHLKPLLLHEPSQSALYDMLLDFEFIPQESKTSDNMTKKRIFIDSWLAPDAKNAIISSQEVFTECLRRKIILKAGVEPYILEFWNRYSDSSFPLRDYINEQTYQQLSQYFITSDGKEILEPEGFISVLFYFSLTECLPVFITLLPRLPKEAEPLNACCSKIPMEPFSQVPSEPSDGEFSHLPSFVLCAVNLMAYIIQQKAVSKRGLKYGEDITFQYCRFSRYAFIAACNYYEPKNDIEYFLASDKESDQWENEPLKYLFSNHIYMAKDSIHLHPINILCFHNISRTLSVLRKEMEYRHIVDVFDYSADQNILDKKTATQKQVWTVLLDVFMNCSESFHKYDSVYKYELNTTLSTYMNAIAFSGFSLTSPENQKLMTDGIMTMLKKRNYHQQYLQILVEQSLDKDTYLLTFEEEADRLGLICRVSNYMFEDNSASYISGFWKSVGEFINSSRLNKISALHQLIRENCMDGHIWRQFLSKNPLQHSKVLRVLISKCIDRNVKEKLINTLSFFVNKKNDNLSKILMPLDDQNFTLKFKRYLSSIILIDEEISENFALAAIKLLQFIEDDEAIIGLLKDRSLDKGKNYPSAFQRLYPISDITAPAVNGEYLLPADWDALHVLHAIEKEPHLLEDNGVRKQIRSLLTRKLYEMNYNFELRTLFKIFLASQRSLYDITDLLMIQFDYGILQELDPEVYAVWSDFINKMRVFSLNPHVTNKLKKQQYKSLVYHLERVSNPDEFQTYLDLLLDFARNLAMTSNLNEHELMYYLVYLILYEIIGIDQVYTKITNKDEIGSRYADIILSLCLNLNKHANGMMLRRYLERILSYLIAYERFLFLPSSLQSQIIHFISYSCDFAAERAILIKMLLLHNRWELLEVNVKAAVISGLNPASMDEYPHIQKFVLAMLDDANTKVRSKYTSKLRYGYNNLISYYVSLIRLTWQNPFQSARLCCFVLADSQGYLDKILAGHTTGLMSDYRLFFANPCIRQFSYLIAKLSLDKLDAQEPEVRKDFCIHNQEYYSCIRHIADDCQFPDWFQYQYEEPPINPEEIIQLHEIEFTSIDNSTFSQIILYTNNQKYTGRLESMRTCSQHCYTEHPVILERNGGNYLLIDGAKTYDCWQILHSEPYTKVPSRVTGYLFEISPAPVIIKEGTPFAHQKTEYRWMGNDASKRIVGLYKDFIRIYGGNLIDDTFLTSIRWQLQILYSNSRISQALYNALEKVSDIIEDAHHHELPSDKEVYYNNVLQILSAQIDWPLEESN